MTKFTALHRALGRVPGPLTGEMVDAAIAAGVAEGADLDFKSELPPAVGLPQTDFPKDIAAMANSGGGTIVYGVTEDQKRATGRVAAVLGENHERALRSAAVTAITPPVLGLEIDRLGEPGQQCVAITVAATQDVPHLIYRHEYFGAPLRNDADTVWMKERQIEAMYRARLDRRRDSTEQLDGLYAQAARGRGTAVRAWLIAVANPRLPALRATRMTRDDARACLFDAERDALDLAGSPGVHPLQHLDLVNPRTGLRSWIAPNRATGTERWREAWASVGEGGSVTLAAAIGGHRCGVDEFWPGQCVTVRGLECAVADFAGLLRATARHLGTGEYDIQLGIEWTGPDPLELLAPDSHFVDRTIRSPDPLPVHFVPVRSTIQADADDEEFHRQAHEIALDCVNQGGIADTHVIAPPPP